MAKFAVSSESGNLDEASGWGLLKSQSSQTRHASPACQSLAPLTKNGNLHDVVLQTVNGFGPGAERHNYQCPLYPVRSQHKWTGLEALR